MTNHVLIASGVVVQSDRTGAPPEGFVQAPNWVVPGCVYNGGDFVLPEPAPIPIADRVSARQFKLQLLAAGLLGDVEAWVASQGQAVQIAYANSGTFVRSEPMMQAGFAALGFTSEQGDAFFVAASEL